MSGHRFLAATLVVAGLLGSGPVDAPGQTVRRSERTPSTISGQPSGIAATRPMVPRSAEELFERLPGELENLDAGRLGLLLAASEVSVALERPDRERSVSSDQAFYLIDKYFSGLRHATSQRLALDGFASPSGRIVCVPASGVDAASSQAVLHLLLESPSGPRHVRIHAEAKKFPRGWRITALRSLD